MLWMPQEMLLSQEKRRKSEMRLIKCILTANDCYKAGRTINPKGVMVHSTGANNPLVARYVQPSNNDPNRDSLQATIGGNRNNNDWNNPGLDVCTHAFIGKLADGGVGTVQNAALEPPWMARWLWQEGQRQQYSHCLRDM